MARCRWKKMEGKKNRATMDLFFFLLFLFPSCLPVQSRKLNMPRILVPYMDNLSINSTLEFSEPGCFKWSTSRSDVVRLTPIEEDSFRKCSNGVVVSSTYRQPTRATAIILAEDYHTGEIVRCDAIVDVIASLGVITTTRELFIEEAQEEFEIRAYDDKGNEFTTLDGISFNWETRNCMVTDTPPVLRTVRFQDTPYQAPPSIEALENTGLRGNRVLLEGLRCGCAKVSSTIAHPFYRNLPAVEVKLSVVANLVLDPAEIYVVPGAKVKFRVLDMQGGHYQEIPVPSSQYKFEVTGPVTLTGAVATANELGDAKVFLKDLTVRDGEEVKEVSAKIHVREAHRMSLEVMPHRNWALMVDELYGLAAEVFEVDGNRIWISDNMAVNMAIPSSHFEVLERSRNGTYSLVSPVRSGEVALEATLKGTKVHARAKAMIYARVYLEPRISLLPWDPIVMPKYHIPIQVTGGGDRFYWSSSNTSVSLVDTRGHVRTTMPGSSVIRAAMVQNENNFGLASVHVLPVASLDILEDDVEGEIGSPMHLSLAMYTALPDTPDIKVGFSRCNEIPFKVEVVGATSDGILYDPVTYHPPESPACAVIPITGQVIGRMKVKVSYVLTNELPTELTIMDDTVWVSTFRPLRVVHPSCGLTVLAVGSSRVLVFEGGPLPFADRPTGYVRRITTDDSSLATVSELHSTHQYRDTYMYRVSCHEEGETEVTLTIGNNTRFSPVLRSASVIVACSSPQWVQLHAVVSQPEDAKCPEQTGRVSTHCYLDTELDVIVTDDKGRRFDNVSGVAFEWNVSSDLASVEVPNGVVVEEVDTGEGYKLCGRTYQVLLTRGKTGNVEVTVTIPLTGAATSLELDLVDDLYVSPAKTTVFNHPSVVADLTVHQGSGFFEFEASSKDVARLTYFEGNRTLQVAPIEDGSMKVTVRDVCLTSRRPATAAVHVSDVHRVEVTVADKVELGGTVTATVRVYDSSGAVLPSGAMALMGLQSEVGSDIITVKAVGTEGRYVIQGDHLGDTTLTFVAVCGTRRSRQVRSIPHPIQVFPPLRLSPRNITLYVGTVLQVSSSGGPQPDAAIEYTVDDPLKAQVTGAGVLEGRHVGHARLRADAVGRDGAIVYSTDEIDVHVVPLDRIKIHTPVTRLRTGTQMPVYVVGANEHQTPALFASDIPFARFEWTVDNSDVVDVTTAFAGTGVDPSDVDKVGVRVVARRVGRVVLKLVARVTQPKWDGNVREEEEPRVFKDAVEIEVFEALRFLRQEHGSEAILMAPVTDLRLRTNRDGTARIGYRVAGPSPEVDAVVHLSRTGIISAGEAVGRAVVVATVEEDFGLSQSISTVVEVKPVTYVSLSARTRLASHGLSRVPRGSRLTMEASYHDGMGAEFSATRCRLRYRATRLDLVQVSPGKQNDTVTARALRSGRAVLKVWCESERRVTDYIMVSVGDAITPDVSMGLTLGDVACFRTPLSGGKWQASSDVMHFVVGGAVAIGAGTTSVTYHADADVTTHTDVLVRPAMRIRFLHQDIHVTNAAPSVVPFMLESDFDVNKTSVFAGRHCDIDLAPFPFRCSTTSDAFSAKPGFDSRRGIYHCLLTPLVAPIPSACTRRSAVTISVTLAASGQLELTTATTLTVLPGFNLHTPEMHLSNVRAYSNIVVSGVSEVLGTLTVESSDISLLSIGLPEETSPDTVAYSVRLRDAFWSDVRRSLSISVESHITNQKITVPVKVNLASGYGDRGYCVPRPIDGSWSSFLLGLMEQYSTWLAFPTTVLIAAGLYAAYHFMFGSHYYASNQSAFLNQSGRPPPQSTPHHMTAGGISPGQDQNRLWSQNETPYYGSPQVMQRSPRT